MRQKSLFVAIALSLAGMVLAQPEPWLHPDGTIHYYHVISVDREINWYQANDSAVARGGYLATLTSPAEDSFLFAQADADLFWRKRPDGRLAGPWLGGYQPVGSPEPDSGWTWITSEPMNYRNWTAGEPDNAGGANAVNLGEAFGRRVGTWNDLRADSSLGSYAVELSAERTTVGLLQNDSDASPGYTLFAPILSTKTYLIDNCGRLIRTWQSAYTPGLSAYLLPDGSLLRPASVNNPFSAPGGRVERYDWNGNLVWAFNCADTLHCQHHDVEPMPNGHVLMVAYESKTRAEALEAGRRPGLVLNSFRPDHVIEVDPATNRIVWEWHVWDHLIQDFDSTKANYGVVAEHPELVDINFGTNYPDWLHINAIDYNPELDQIALSVRNLNEIWIIDHSTTTAEARGHTGGRQGMGGDILYRWGNPQAYRAGTAMDQVFFGQHDVRWIEPGLPGAGNLMVYNNGLNRPGGSFSTVDEFTPPADSTGRYPRPLPGVPHGPRELVWSYRADPPSSLFSAYISGAHRLPNGNTLICEGGKGNFREVTADNRIVWRYQNPVAAAPLMQGDDPINSSSVFRATRYAPDFPGFNGRDLEPGYPIEHYQTPALALARTGPIIGQDGRHLWAQPNPVRYGATIRFGLQLGQRVRMTIFDGSGRAVRMLLDSYLGAGEHAVGWDGLDDFGNRLAMGVYFCRLAGESESSTITLTLLGS